MLNIQISTQALNQKSSDKSNVFKVAIDEFSLRNVNLHEVNYCFPSIAALFYYVIGNIRPKLRSSLRVIQLIACVTYPNLWKYGFQKILQPFIDDVNILAKVRAGMQY